MSPSSSGRGSFASSNWYLRSDRCALRVALFATPSSQGSAESPLNLTSLRRRHASRNTTEVRSSAIDQEPVRLKQCAYTRSACRSKSSLKASPANSLAACDHSSWSPAEDQSMPTPLYVRQEPPGSQSARQRRTQEGDYSP